MANDETRALAPRWPEVWPRIFVAQCRRRRWLALLMLATFLCAAPIHAAVTSYTLQRRNALNQEPNGSGYFISSDFTVTVETSAAGDFAAIALTGPPPADVPAALAKTGGTFNLFTFTGTSPDEEFMSFPLGVYTLTATGGAFGPQSATFDDSAPALGAAPFFTNFEHYEHRHAGEPVTIDVSGFTPRPGSTHNFANYRLMEDDSLGHLVTLVEGMHNGSAPFSFGLPAGVTRTDRVYLISAEFVSETHVPHAGFGGATAIVRGVGSSGSYFHVMAVPEPAGVAPLVAGVILFARRRRARSNEPDAIACRLIYLSRLKTERRCVHFRGPTDIDVQFSADSGIHESTFYQPAAVTWR